MIGELSTELYCGGSKYFEGTVIGLGTEIGGCGVVIGLEINDTAVLLLIGGKTVDVGVGDDGDGVVLENIGRYVVIGIYPLFSELLPSIGSELYRTNMVGRFFGYP